jgi:hypothetical protein
MAFCALAGTGTVGGEPGAGGVPGGEAGAAAGGAAACPAANSMDPNEQVNTHTAMMPETRYKRPTKPPNATKRIIYEITNY